MSDISAISFTINGSTSRFDLKLGEGDIVHFVGTTTTALTDGASTNTITIGGQSHAAQNGDIAKYSGTYFIWDATATEWHEFVGASIDATSAHFLGTTTTAISDGSATSSITISGQSHTAANGDIVIYSGSYFVWDATATEWRELGGSGGGVNAVNLTEAEYDALTTAQKNNGTIYFVYKADGIEITTPPTKTEYHGNDNEFTSTGLVVSYVTNDGANSTNVTSSVTLSCQEGDVLTIPDGQTSQVHRITASYTTGGHTYTASFDVTVYET